MNGGPQVLTTSSYVDSVGPRKPLKLNEEGRSVCLSQEKVQRSLGPEVKNLVNADVSVQLGENNSSEPLEQTFRISTTVLGTRGSR